MITTIKNYSLSDIRTSVNYLLDKSTQDPDIRNLAVEITSGTPDPIAAIYDWVKANVTYVPDPVDTELFTSPVKMVNDYRQGSVLVEDCEGIALWTVALCRAIGIEAHVARLEVKGKGLDHAVAIVHSDRLGRDITVDATSTNVPLGWEIPYFKKEVI